MAPRPRTASPRSSADELSDAKAKQAALAKQIADQKAAVAQITAMQSDMSRQITETKQELSKINADLNAVRNSINVMVAQIEVVKKQYFALVARLQLLDNQLANLVKQESHKRSELGTRKALLAERIRTAYDTDRTSMLETFLSGGSFTDVIAEVGYINDFAEQDKSLAEQIVKDQEELAAHPLHRGIDADPDRRPPDRDGEAEGGARQAARRAAGGAGPAQGARDRDGQGAGDPEGRLRPARQEQEGPRPSHQDDGRGAGVPLGADREPRQAAVQARQHPVRLQRHAEVADGRQRDGRVRLQFVSGLRAGQRLRPLPQRHRHRRRSGCGAPIKAAGDGRIGYVGWNYADGGDPAWIVIVAHSQDLQTWYAHMKPLAPNGIRVGAAVKAGTVIGYEGNTGNSTGCHLHWMVEYKGSFRNPRLFV